MGARLKINFTQDKLNNLPLPPEGKLREIYYDTQQRNLCLFVTPSGTKTFYVCRTVNHRQHRFMIGRYGEIDIRRARERAAKYAAALANGETKSDILDRPAHAASLNDFMRVYLERHAKPHKESWRYDESNYNVHVRSRPLGRYLLGQIKLADVLKLHVELGQTSGEVIANRVISLLSVMFNKAIDWGYHKGDNPVSKVKKFRETSRERFLKGDELPAFWKALEETPHKNLRDFVLLALFTGARKMNVLSMRWADIDFSAREWRIPKTKNGDALTVPLVGTAMHVLETRRAKIDGDYVFPPLKADSTTPHMVEIKRGWDDIMIAAGMKDKEGNWLTEKLTLHDLRRTSGSWQTMTGSNAFIVGKSLGHKTSKATQVYARLDLDPVRVSLNNAAIAMMKFKPSK